MHSQKRVCFNEGENIYRYYTMVDNEKREDECGIRKKVFCDSVNRIEYCEYTEIDCKDGFVEESIVLVEDESLKEAIPDYYELRQFIYEDYLKHSKSDSADLFESQKKEVPAVRSNDTIELVDMRIESIKNETSEKYIYDANSDFNISIINEEYVKTTDESNGNSISIVTIKNYDTENLVSVHKEKHLQSGTSERENNKKPDSSAKRSIFIEDRCHNFSFIKDGPSNKQKKDSRIFLSQVENPGKENSGVFLQKNMPEKYLNDLREDAIKKNIDIASFSSILQNIIAYLETAIVQETSHGILKHRNKMDNENYKSEMNFYEKIRRDLEIQTVLYEREIQQKKTENCKFTNKEKINKNFDYTEPIKPETYKYTRKIGEHTCVDYSDLPKFNEIREKLHRMDIKNAIEQNFRLTCESYDSIKKDTSVSGRNIDKRIKFNQSKEAAETPVKTETKTSRFQELLRFFREKESESIKNT